MNKKLNKKTHNHIGKKKYIIKKNYKKQKQLNTSANFLPFSLGHIQRLQRGAISEKKFSKTSNNM